MAKINYTGLRKVLSSEIHARQFEDALLGAVEMSAQGQMPLIGISYPRKMRRSAFSVEVRDALNGENAIIPADGSAWEPILTLW